MPRRSTSDVVSANAYRPPVPAAYLVTGASFSPRRAFLGADTLPTWIVKAAPRSFAEAIKCSCLTCLIGDPRLDSNHGFSLEGYQVRLRDQTKLPLSWA